MLARSSGAEDPHRLPPLAVASALDVRSMFGSLRSSQAGSHHTRGPRTRMIDGSRTSLTIVASSTTAIVSPTPNWRSGMTSAPANARNTAVMIAAEPVITPAVCRRP